MTYQPVDFGKIAADLIEEIGLAFKWFRPPEDRDGYMRLVSRWERALRAAGRIYPPFVYSEALDLIIANAKASDDPPMPGDIISAAEKVIERIESDRVRGPALKKWRDDYKYQRVAELTGES